MEGIALLELAAKKSPEDLGIRFELGWGYRRLKQYPKAVKAFEAARKIAPEDFRVGYGLSAVYQSMGEHGRAESELRALLKKHPDDPVANNALGYFFAETSRNLDEAAELVKKALEVDPENGAYIDSLGWVYYQQGKLGEALKLLEDAFEKEEDGVIAEHLGDVLYRLNRQEEARKYWKRAEELDPWLESSTKRLKLLKSGKNPLQDGKP